MRLDQMTDVELSDVREWNIERGLDARALGDKTRMRHSFELGEQIHDELQRRIDECRAKKAAS